MRWKWAVATAGGGGLTFSASFRSYDRPLDGGDGTAVLSATRAYDGGGGAAEGGEAVGLPAGVLRLEWSKAKGRAVELLHRVILQPTSR